MNVLDHLSHLLHTGRGLLEDIERDVVLYHQVSHHSFLLPIDVDRLVGRSRAGLANGPGTSLRIARGEPNLRLDVEIFPEMLEGSE